MDTERSEVDLQGRSVCAKYQFDRIVCRLNWMYVVCVEMTLRLGSRIYTRLDNSSHLDSQMLDAILVR
jgi:hypothetical protein